MKQDIDKQRNDFALLMIAYVVTVAIICFAVPIGKIWAEVMVILFFMSCVLQSYWNKYLKK